MNDLIRFLALIILTGVFVFGLKTCVDTLSGDTVMNNTDQFDYYDMPIDTMAVDSLFDSYGKNAIKRIVIHCTASFGNLDSTRLMGVFKQRWGQNARPGYHFVVFKDGNIVILKPLDRDGYISSDELVWGAKGYNSSSIHISYDGGIDRYMNPLDTRTQAQKNALQTLVDKFTCRYPNIEVIGHRNISTKACPSFDALETYRDGTLINTNELFDTLDAAVDSTERSLN